MHCAVEVSEGIKVEAKCVPICVPGLLLSFVCDRAIGLLPRVALSFSLLSLSLSLLSLCLLFAPSL